MDKQVEEQIRSEPKLENLKTKLRTGSPTENSRSRIDDLESRNFTLEEEVKDLRIQLSEKQNEITKSQELVNKRTSELEKTKSECEEKVKKMKGIFNAANKSINELRQSVASKDAEIEELKTTIESMKEKDQMAKSSVDDSQKSVDKLTTEIRSQAAMYNAQIEQLESKLRQVTQQSTQVKSEFQQYKTRAHALLEQRNSTNENVITSFDVSELVVTNKKLESDLSLKIAELNYAQEKIRVTEKDLKRAFELNTQIEKEFKKAQKAAHENADSIKVIHEKLQNLTEENKSLKNALHEIEARYTSNVKDFDDRLLNSTDTIQKSLKQKQEENEQLQSISENLSEELTKLRAELLQRTEQFEELQKQLAANQSSHSRTNSQKDSNRPSLLSQSQKTKTSSRPSSTYSSLSDLLADTEERSPIISSSTLGLSDKEKDYAMKLHHMAEMLNESEAHIQKLIDQEKILKDEIRKLDRLEKRQNLNVEYLKNVVLKFFEANPMDREPLVPVISTILQLSPEETISLKENALNNPASGHVVMGFGVL